MRYVQRFTLTAGAAGVFGTEVVIRLNDLFAPSLTGSVGGHQPYGFDQLAALYYNYKVNAVRVRICFSDPSADGVICGAFFQNPNESSSIQGLAQQTMMEKPGSWYGNVNNTGVQVVEFKQRFEMHKLCNLSRLQFDANIENYQAAVTATPTLNPFLRLAIASLDNSSVPTVRVELELIFESVFFDRSQQAGSS